MKADRTIDSDTTIVEALRQVVLGLASVQRTLRDGLERATAQDGMRLADWLILGELMTGSSSLSALSISLERDPGSLSRAVNRLVGRRLVTSLRLKRDRRRTCLALTTAGSAMHRRLTRRLEHLARTSPNLIGQWALAELQLRLQVVLTRIASHSATGGAPNA